MFERILTPALAFMLLAGGTFAIGSELFASGRSIPAARISVVEIPGAVIELPRVEVTGRRLAAPLKIAEAGLVQRALTCLQ